MSHMSADKAHRFCVAPMMDGTDRHCRFFHRLMTRRAFLYSEMVTAQAVIHGDRDHLLDFDDSEHNVALQLGGSDPDLLRQAALIGAEYGYDEINLNVGCPSDRVQSGTFGACLMKAPKLVADCVDAMASNLPVPVTVKCRIGVDEQDPEESLFAFVDHVKAAGCRLFIVHARKAWLQGLSPKDNRTIPPLDYDIVRRLKVAHPDLTIIINGGIETIDQAVDHLKTVDGVMLGRAAYSRPFILNEVDERIYGEGRSTHTPESVAWLMDHYIREHCKETDTQNWQLRPNAITRHMLGLYHGRPRARHWRRYLSEQGGKTPIDIVTTALERMEAMQSQRLDSDYPCQEQVV